MFVPASQTGLPRETPMSTLVKEKVRVIITEVNRARRRVVGSISRVIRAERAAAAEKVWAEIEEGKHYTGTVKSLTSYGAFVDIGGVDGLIHISQIADHRIEKPGDVLAEGDKVDVKITDVDMENKKVSLSIRALLEEGPADEEPAEDEE